MRDHTNLRWNGLELYVGQQTKPLLAIVPDARCPGMWRIRNRDGQLSDLVNVSRAIDAANTIALAELNAPKGGICREARSLVRLPRQGLSDQGATSFERVLARGAS